MYRRSIYVPRQQGLPPTPFPPVAPTRARSPPPDSPDLCDSPLLAYHSKVRTRRGDQKMRRAHTHQSPVGATGLRRSVRGMRVCPRLLRKCTVFGLLGATANEAGGTDATALKGFTRIGPDPWLRPQAHQATSKRRICSSGDTDDAAPCPSSLADTAALLSAFPDIPELLDAD